jgi:hypothetical protein
MWHYDLAWTSVVRVTTGLRQPWATKQEARSEKEPFGHR